MNHKYILLLLACTAGAAQAQRVNTTRMPAWAHPERPVRTHASVDPTAAQARDAGDIVFSEDFANGLAGNNGFGAWTTNEANGDMWHHTMLPPSGAYTDPSEVINSTTDSNGWMLLATDSANTEWSDTTIVAAPQNWDAGLVSPVLDLSATPFVSLDFEMAGRWCCSDNPFFVQVSTDGGGNWTSYQALDLVVNDGSGTVTASVNISGAIVAGDASNVTFRFMHDGTTAGSSHYYWQVDDVKLVEVFDYDLALTNGAHSNWDPATAFTYDSLRYSVLPYSQLRPLPLNMTVANNGSQDQTGTIANFLVMEGANTVLDQDQIVDIPAGITQTIFVNPDFVPPATAGTYNVDYTATSVVGDNSTGNNDASSTFKVSEFLYGRDLGTAATFVNNTDATEYELCNAFHIANDVELYSIDVAIRKNATGDLSPEGFPILGILRDGSDVTVDFAETEEHTILASELNNANGTKFISMIFSDPQFLDAGTDYIVCVRHYGDVELRTGINGVSEAQSSYIYYDDPTNGLDWYYTTSTPMVRMNFNPSVGIEEGDIQNGVGMGQNFPNPTDVSTTIPYSLTKAGTVALEVHDLSGKLINTINVGKRPTGAHRVELNTSAMNQGVYFYSLVVDGVRLTKRMTVVR